MIDSVKINSSISPAGEEGSRGALQSSPALRRIPVTVQIVLGAAKLSLAEVAALKKGGVVRLDRRIGEPVDVLVNGRAIGRGEIVVVEGDDARFAVSITEILDGAHGANNA